MPRILAFPLPPACSSRALYRWLDWHLQLADRANEVETVGWCSVEPRLVATAA